MKVKKLKFKLTDYVDSTIIKLYVTIIVSFLIIALLTIVGVQIYRYSKVQDFENRTPLYTEEDISAILKSPGLTDFIIPESLEDGENGFTLYREPLKEWTSEMVDHYIIAPEDLGIDKISMENKKLIESKLEEAP